MLVAVAYEVTVWLNPGPLPKAVVVKTAVWVWKTVTVPLSPCSVLYEVTVIVAVGIGDIGPIESHDGEAVTTMGLAVL